TISRAPTSTVATGGTFTYNGGPEAGSCTNGATASYAPGGATVPVNVGSYTLTCTIAQTENYAGSSDHADIKINKAAATVVVAPYSVTFDTAPHTAAVTSITGGNGETGATVGTVTLTSTHTNAAVY